jgi:hypothetical protein
MTEGGHISQLVCSCPIRFESANMSDLTCSPDGAAAFPKLLEQGEEAVAAASANEEMTGAAVVLGKEMFKGTILDVAGQALPLLSGVLTIAKEFPFLGPIVNVLNEFKKMVEKYQDAEEECKRLVVWCVALNPEP